MLSNMYFCTGKSENMKKLLGLFCVIVIAAAMVVTCPDKNAHMDAIRNEFSMAIDDIMADDVKSEGANAAYQVVKSLALPLLETVWKNKLDYSNYFVLSTTAVKDEGEKKTISIGVFGHVFTFDREDVVKEFEKYYNEESGGKNDSR